jgi:hypothetical protein
MAFSPSLSNCGNPGATLARAYLNSVDLTSTERSEREMCPWAISKYFGD